MLQEASLIEIVVDFIFEKNFNENGCINSHWLSLQACLLDICKKNLIFSKFYPLNSKKIQNIKIFITQILWTLCAGNTQLHFILFGLIVSVPVGVRQINTSATSSVKAIKLDVIKKDAISDMWLDINMCYYWFCITFCLNHYSFS